MTHVRRKLERGVLFSGGPAGPHAHDPVKIPILTAPSGRSVSLRQVGAQHLGASLFSAWPVCADPLSRTLGDLA